MEKWIYSSDSQLRHTLKSPGKRPKPSCLRPPRDPHLIGEGVAGAGREITIAAYISALFAFAFPVNFRVLKL